MEKLILNKENKQKLRQIIDACERDLYFHIFLDIHALSEYKKRILQGFSKILLNRYKWALFYVGDEINFLDRFLDFSSGRQVFRGDKDQIIQRDNWDKIRRFYHRYRHGK